MSLIGLIFIIVFIILIIFTKSDYINISEPIRNYTKVLKKNKKEIVIFYLYPMIFSIGVIFLSSDLNELYSEISIIVGIILSMLFAGLSILTTYDFSIVLNDNQREKSKKAVEETVHAIKFDSLACLFLLIIIILVKIKFGYDILLQYLSFVIPIIRIVIPVIVLYLFLIVILTLLMIIKNMFLIIIFNINVKKNNNLK